ncbi:sigma-70 family RNA polymerase sigma factor [Neobacillus sp. DY30]|uniref:sigma-70 family RNA polymerase sigma factor n=1 Tax=Neobacillus sp. DY30 TaxID=3047871 RepID=UPI0024C04EB3|nr:sigma-70 family RNA polymerase sigma factor [Neobacillus sp. DY30]WHY00040.1 sigma-70 family RNA polymerase sigma factor [Neobacillus sp. DY30]
MESFEQLAIQYEPMIQRIISSLHIYKNKDEFRQQGLIALWEASKRFDPGKGNFSTYAYHYIKGYILMELTKETVESERNFYPKEEFWEYAEAPCTGEAPLEKDIFMRYGRNLTPNQRKWLFHTAVEGLSVSEIAEKEKVSLSAVKSWRKGAREKLKIAMGSKA